MRWIVTLVPGASVADAVDAAEDVGGKPGLQFTNVVLGFTMSGSPDAAAALAKNPNVVRIFPDGAVRLASDPLAPTGVARIAGPVAQAAGHDGAGATVAVIDSGVDLTHPDLLANLHPTLGKNCLDPPFDALPPQDGNGHGTHVAGIVAAAANGIGVAGVAPGATIVPVQSFDAAGDAHWSNVICGIDYVAAHADEIDVANMSFGDLSTAATSCVGDPTGDFDLLRKAVCRARAAGVVMVAAAGNNMIDAGGFVPAAFPEVITVSALTDFDGLRGGAAGCLDLFGILCDDTFAYLFSNYGSVVDVMAPGFEILSTVPGGYALKDGTSMAAPHVAGVAALMKGVDPDLTHDEIAYMLRRHGECPDGSAGGADGACVGQGDWAADPDSFDEPLVHAERSALAATVDALPEATLTAPTGGVVSGAVALGATAADDRGVAQVAWTVDGTTVAVDTNGADGWSGSWATGATPDGTRAVRAVVTDSGGQTASSAPASVRVLNHLHVGAVTGTSVAELSTWRASATVTVHDGSHGVVAGASVTVSSPRGGGSCVTGADGRCTVWSNSIPRSVASVTMTVSSLTVTGGVRDPSADHATSVVVTRP